MGTRRKARELALECLYSIEQGGKGLDEALNGFRTGKFSPPASNFAEELVRNVVGNLEEIDNKIRSCSINWRISRILPTDKNILRLAVSELMQKDTPPAVVIDEAVEIAKKYGAEKSSRFINGVLDCVLKKSFSSALTGSRKSGAE